MVNRDELVEAGGMSGRTNIAEMQADFICGLDPLAVSCISVFFGGPVS